MKTVDDQPTQPPEQKEPAEAEYFFEYITYSDLFRTVPTWEMFFERLRGISLRHLMMSLSFINSVMYVRGTLGAQADLVNGTFDTDLKQAIKSRTGWERRVVYSPAQTLLVMKAAILHSPDHNDEQDLTSYARSLAEILLMANDLLDGDLRATIEATPSTDDPNVLARLLLPHSIRATLANSADPYDTSLARASMIFTQLAVRDDVRSRAKGAWTDISKRFRAQTGLSLQDYFAIGWMLMQWFAGGVRDPQKNINQRKLIPATFFSETSTTLSL